MEIRLQFTVAEHGFDPDNGERYMDAFMATFPEGGPSISQNLRDGTLTITFALQAEGVNEAVTQAVEIFERGRDAVDLPPARVLDVEGSAVEAEDAEDARKLEPVGA
jgi:hypothetical protein